MDWRDLLYFSKGERRALTLLLCLITVSWILLLQTDKKRMLIEAQTENRQASGERQIIIGKDTSGQAAKTISLYLIRQFYLSPYKKEEDFYPQFEERLTGAKRALAGFLAM